jgi:2,4-dienoyl-CoA reductase-like NADH-dependent reductase (Old Yellow Enzyme family)
VLGSGKADAVAVGQLFITNHDLALRFAEDAPLNTPDSSTFYASGLHGYIDFPGLNVHREAA